MKLSSIIKFISRWKVNLKVNFSSTGLKASNICCVMENTTANMITSRTKKSFLGQNCNLLFFKCDILDKTNPWIGWFEFNLYGHPTSVVQLDR